MPFWSNVFSTVKIRKSGAVSIMIAMIYLKFDMIPLFSGIQFPSQSSSAGAVWADAVLISLVL